MISCFKLIKKIVSLLFGEGNGTPLQYSCLENPMDGGTWWAAVHGVAKIRTWLSDFTFTFHFNALEKEMATHSSVLFFFPFIFNSWRLITLQYCSGFCHTLTWISHGFTCVPHPDHFSVLAWRMPGTGESGGLLSVGSHRVEHNWSDLAAAAASLLLVDFSSDPLLYLAVSLHSKTWINMLVLCQVSCSVVSHSLRTYEPQNARPLCPSSTHGVHANPCPLCLWCHPTISSSVVPFSSCPQSFPASGSFQMNQMNQLSASSPKALEFQLQHQSLQWTRRTDLL